MTNIVNDTASLLDSMCDRIRRMRSELAAAIPVLEYLREQRGMFSILPLDAGEVKTLREDHGVYMPSSGRINLAGLSSASIPRFVSALRAVKHAF